MKTKNKYRLSLEMSNASKFAQSLCTDLNCLRLFCLKKSKTNSSLCDSNLSYFDYRIDIKERAFLLEKKKKITTWEQ